MKKILRSGVTLTLAVILAAGAAACKNDKDGKATETPGANGGVGDSGVKISAPGVFPIVEEKITLTVVAPYADYVGDLNTNRFGLWYEEKTNVHVDYKEVPEDAGQMAEQVNLMLVSGNLPDIFMNTVMDANLNGSRGVYIPLNDLIEKYGVETKKIFAEKSNILPGMITAVDGNIYALPNINDCFHCAHAIRAWINKGWLDELGLSYPNTTAEFENVLRAFKNDGSKSGVIPMTGAGAAGWNTKIYPFLLNSFVYYDDEQLTYTENGTVKFAANTEEFRNGLRWIKSLIDEGLIEKLALTQTSDQLLAVGYDPSNTIGAFTAAGVFGALPYDDGSDPNNISRTYVGLSPLEGPTGFRNSPLTGTGVGTGRDSAVITKNSKYPDVAFRWLDGLYTDEATLYSQAGMDHITPPADAVGINGKPAVYVPYPFLSYDEARDSRSWMQNVALANRTNDFRLGEMADYGNPETQWSMEPRLYNETAKYFTPYAHDDLSTPPSAFSESEDSDRAMYYTQIHDYVQESIVLFLTGGKDLEKGWDAYVKEFNALKLDEYMKLLQTAYDRQYK